MTKQHWKKVWAEISRIDLYQNGNCIIIWQGNTHHTFWDYTQREAVKLFKQKYNITGKVHKTTFCPFLSN